MNRILQRENFAARRACNFLSFRSAAEESASAVVVAYFPG
jgi:hypothetical protein